MAIWILSRQQRRVLQCVACGLTYEQVGKHTGIKKATVKNVMTVVFRKLNARCRIDAIYTGIQLGEISELHAYAYVEARQVANYSADNKQPDIRLRRRGHDFLIASNNKTLVPYSSNRPF